MHCFVENSFNQNYFRLNCWISKWRKVNIFKEEENYSHLFFRNGSLEKSTLRANIRPNKFAKLRRYDSKVSFRSKKFGPKFISLISLVNKTVSRRNQSWQQNWLLVTHFPKTIFLCIHFHIYILSSEAFRGISLCFPWRWKSFITAKRRKSK